MDDPGSIQTEHIMETYLKYLENVLAQASSQKETLERLYSLMDKEKAGAIHIFGFGRSGSAALSLAIRLRHFCECLPPVWWVGDQVRMPIRQGDVVILFSSSGKREEVISVAEKAVSVGATIVLVTKEGSNNEKDPKESNNEKDPKESNDEKDSKESNNEKDPKKIINIRDVAEVVIDLPTMNETFVYGGGDFELAAYLLQEVIVAEIGTRKKIPKYMVDKYHV